jgi:hypothetical protein
MPTMLKRASLILVAAAAGCGGTTDTGTMMMMTPDMANPSPMPTVQPMFSSLMGDYFGKCGQCHAPGAPGRTSTIEMTLDFSTAATAYTSITSGKAKGLMGNTAGCNMVPFVTPMMPQQSLIVAVVDQPTRAAFDLPPFTSCDSSAISDETVKVGSPPSADFVTALQGWITAGAPNN